MSQEALDFGRDHRVTEAHRSMLRALNDAVDAVSLIVAAGSCGCRTSELSDALSGRANRYMRIEWVLAIADVAPVDFKHRISVAFVAWLGFRVDAQRPLKPEEKLARLEARIATRFGQAGLELVEENKR
jgi:hypothetical protein